MPPHETHAPSVAQYEPEGAKWRHAVHADAASKQQAQAAVIAIDAVVTDHVRHQCHRSPFVGLVGLQHKSRPNSRNAQRGALATAGVVCPLGRRRPSARGSMHTIFDPCFTAEESVPGPLSPICISLHFIFRPLSFRTFPTFATSRTRAPTHYLLSYLSLHFFLSHPAIVIQVEIQTKFRNVHVTLKLLCGGCVTPPSETSVSPPPVCVFKAPRSRSRSRSASHLYM